MKYQLLTTTIFLSLLVACSQGQSKSQNTKVHRNKVITLNGETPDVYFKRFLYKTTGKCSDKEGIHFQYLSTFHEYIKLPNAENGKEQLAMLNIFLMEDGTYIADYTKMIKADDTGIPNSRYVHIFSERFGGKTSLNTDGRLTLEGIGVLSALIYNEKPAALLSVENDDLAEGISGQKILVTMVSSNAGLESYNKICPGR